jgi:hypothetical protein
MANQNSNNFVENVLNAQKQVVETLVENTKKMANGNTMANETIEKGSEWYKNWMDSQKNIFNQTSEKANTTTEKVKEGASKMNEFYQNWYNTQLGWAKQMWELNANMMKNTTSNTASFDMNPTTMFNNWMSMMNNMNTGANFMNNGANFMNQMQNMNPFNMDAWKKGTESWNGIFNQYNEMLKGNMADWQKNFQTGTVQDAYSNMVNVAEGFTRFYEMWMPLWKSVQDKSFNMEMFKEWANPVMYKELMDKYFGFMPESSRQYMQNMSTLMQDGMKQMNAMGGNNFQQMRGMMNGMPGMNTSEMFGNMLNGYNSIYGSLNDAFAPLTKMMPANQQTKTMMEWNDISNRMMVYNIKNAELQYMIYSNGSKVMDKLAENIMQKIENGGEFASMMALYQEWLNISDKVYVGLFESDEYSKLMAEVSSLQLKLRKDIEIQLEKTLVGLPVATRSEMDEMYKTIYDLKKQVRQLEKMLDIEMEEEEPVAKTTKSTKTTSRKK